MLSSLNDKVVFITGAGSGMGRATAITAAHAGATVSVVDVNLEAAERTVSEIQAAGGSARAYRLDVCDVRAIHECVDAVEREQGAIEGAVLCAGISRASRAEDLDEALWCEVVDTNMKGAFFCCQAIGKRMIDRRNGSIVVIASTDAFSGQSGRVHYCASKYGVIGVVQTLAIEWGRYGIRVNAVAPGVVDTPMMHRNLPPDLVQEVLVDRTPFFRLPTAEDQANASLFLVSAASGCITGIVMPVDGGLSTGHLTRWKGGDYGSKALMERGIYQPPA